MLKTDPLARNYTQAEARRLIGQVFTCTPPAVCAGASVRARLNSPACRRARAVRLWRLKT